VASIRTCTTNGVARNPVTRTGPLIVFETHRKNCCHCCLASSARPMLTTSLWMRLLLLPAGRHTVSSQQRSSPRALPSRSTAWGSRMKTLKHSSLPTALETKRQRAVPAPRSHRSSRAHGVTFARMWERPSTCTQARQTCQNLPVRFTLEESAIELADVLKNALAGCVTARQPPPNWLSGQVTARCAGPYIIPVDILEPSIGPSQELV
jgi:hypothetical protein